MPLGKPRTLPYTTPRSRTQQHRKSFIWTIHNNEYKGAVSSRDTHYSSSTDTAGSTYPMTTISCSSLSGHSALPGVKGTCCGSHTWKAQQPHYTEPCENAGCVQTQHIKSSFTQRQHFWSFLRKILPVVLFLSVFPYQPSREQKIFWYSKILALCCEQNVAGRFLKIQDESQGKGGSNRADIAWSQFPSVGCTNFCISYIYCNCHSEAKVNAKIFSVVFLKSIFPAVNIL